MKYLTIPLLLLLSGSVIAQQLSDSNFKPTIKNPAYAAASGPRILIDQGHHNRHQADSGFKPFAELLRSDGYVVSAHAGTFTQKSLRSADIMVISNALHKTNVRRWRLPTPSAFSKDEIHTLNTWVKDGGALLLIADHMPYPGAAHELAASFGFRFNNGFAYAAKGKKGTIRFNRKNDSLAEHDITSGLNKNEHIRSFMTFTGSAFQAPTDAKPLLIFPKSSYSLMPERAWKFDKRTPKKDISGWLQGSTLKYGKGRIAVFGEAASFTAQLVGKRKKKVGMNAPKAKDNVQMALNVVHWLSGKLDSKDDA